MSSIFIAACHHRGSVFLFAGTVGAAKEDIKMTFCEGDRSELKADRFDTANVFYGALVVEAVAVLTAEISAAAAHFTLQQGVKHKLTEYW